METEKEQAFTLRETTSQLQGLRHQLGSLAAHPGRRGALLYWAVLLTLSAAVMHVVAIVKQLPPSALLAALLLSFTIVKRL